jgi:hypothetical protein
LVERGSITDTCFYRIFLHFRTWEVHLWKPDSRLFYKSHILEHILQINTIISLLAMFGGWHCFGHTLTPLLVIMKFGGSETASILIRLWLLMFFPPTKAQQFDWKFMVPSSETSICNDSFCIKTLADSLLVHSQLVVL